MLSLIIGAGILGVIIAIMEQGEFPGWGKMVICALAAGVPSFILTKVLPPTIPFLILSTLVGAASATVAIMITTGMPIKRAAIASGIYFVIQLGIGIGFVLAFSK
ncbi:MAG: hypothetical protein ACRC8S_09575 [Fimbriiglobus sp.]